MDFTTLNPNADGLVTAVVQDATTGSVLMVAFMNGEALDLTVRTGFVHFWSRSRQEIWKKGATSGNTLSLLSISDDCDGDAVLVKVLPSGPVCHEGTATCFGSLGDPSLGAMIETLAGIIEGRARSADATSYTARLLSDGDLAARKVLEEAGEVAFAAKDVATGGDTERVAEEAADLVYHLMVLLAGCGVGGDRVAGVLRKRMSN